MKKVVKKEEEMRVERMLRLQRTRNSKRKD